MLVSLTVLWAITPGRQVIVSNRVLQEFFQVTSYNAGFLTESLEHVLILSYVMAASILVITPITMFIFLVREVGLVKVSVEDRDIDPFGTIMNRKMITKLTTIGALAIITGLQAYFTVTGRSLPARFAHGPLRSAPGRHGGELPDRLRMLCELTDDPPCRSCLRRGLVSQDYTGGRRTGEV